MKKTKLNADDLHLVIKTIDIALYVIEDAAVSGQNQLSEEDRTAAWLQVDKMVELKEKTKLCLASL